MIPKKILIKIHTTEADKLLFNLFPAVHCEPLHGMKNADLDINSTLVGSRALYTCHEGHHYLSHNGNNDRVTFVVETICQLLDDHTFDGSWSWNPALEGYCYRE